MRKRLLLTVLAILRICDMRYVLISLFFLCAVPVSASAQTRGADDGSSANTEPPADMLPSQGQPKPIDLHAQALKRQAEARAKAEARGRGVHILPEVKMYCSNNVPTAGDARVAWQAAKLEELEARLQQKIAELDSKRAEYEAWMRKREDALKKANEQIVAIYSKMAPEAAANELSQMDDALAAAVLAKLNTRSASAILGEMDPARAAHLTDEMAGANFGDGKKS